MEEPLEKRTRRGISENQRSWADLDSDLLLIIYHKLGIKDLILSGASLCCSSWYKASKDPSLWIEVDLNGFSSSCIKNKVQFRKLIEFVVERGGGSITSMRFSLMADEDDLLYVAERCPRLKHFSLRSISEHMDGEKVFLAISKLNQLISISIDEDKYLGDVLIFCGPVLNFVYAKFERIFNPVDKVLYQGIIQFFKHAWKLVYQVKGLRCQIQSMDSESYKFISSARETLFSIDKLEQIESGLEKATADDDCWSECFAIIKPVFRKFISYGFRECNCLLTRAREILDMLEPGQV